MKIEKNDIGNLIKEFRHRCKGKVRFAEVDSFNVVHNLQYLFWVEWARSEYVSAVGILKPGSTFDMHFPIMSVHTEIDHLNSAKFNDEYYVYTKISRIGKSSVTFENLVTLIDGSPLVIAKNISVLTDIISGKSVEIPQKIRDLINNYENVSY